LFILQIKFSYFKNVKKSIKKERNIKEKKRKREEKLVKSKKEHERIDEPTERKLDRNLLECSQNMKNQNCPNKYAATQIIPLSCVPY
jgi:hypothetical protein